MRCHVGTVSNIPYIVMDGTKAIWERSTKSSNLDDSTNGEGTVIISRVGIKGMRSDRGLEGRE